MSSNPNDILKSAVNFYEKLYPKETTSKSATSKPFSNISNRKKSQNEQLNRCEANISLEKVTQSITSQTYNKSPSNYNLKAKICKHFSNELSLSF